MFRKCGFFYQFEHFLRSSSRARSVLREELSCRRARADTKGYRSTRYPISYREKLRGKRTANSIQRRMKRPILFQFCRARAECGIPPAKHDTSLLQEPRSHSRSLRQFDFSKKEREREREREGGRERERKSIRSSISREPEMRGLLK